MHMGPLCISTGVLKKQLINLENTLSMNKWLFHLRSLGVGVGGGDVHSRLLTSVQPPIVNFGQPCTCKGGGMGVVGVPQRNMCEGGVEKCAAEGGMKKYTGAVKNENMWGGVGEIIPSAPFRISYGKILQT